MNQLWIHGVKFLLDPVYHGNVGGVGGRTWRGGCLALDLHDGHVIP